MPEIVSHESACEQDRNDPLRGFRDRFVLPPETVYLCGNSLGALPKAAVKRMRETQAQHWGRDLVKSWNTAGWVDWPRRLGDKIGRLIGAREGEVVVADSTTVNLYKLLSAALRLRPDRGVILSDRDNFRTDLYVAQGLVESLGGRHELRLEPPDGWMDAIDESVAVVMLSHVSFHDGRLHDMAAITRRAHEAGALVLWDLAHSAGAMPLDLKGCDVDFAVGCGYKFLNGGPGAPSFVHVAKRLQADTINPIAGWFGHARPFEFVTEYEPAPGINRLQVGTPPILGLAALDAAVDLMLEASLKRLRAKSLRLADVFWAALQALAPDADFVRTTPTHDAERGSQLCLRHPQAWPIMQALHARGVIGDVRAPDVLRFGFAPMYLRHVDAFDAAAALAEVVASGEWRRPKFQQRARVT